MKIMDSFPCSSSHFRCPREELSKAQEIRIEFVLLIHFLSIDKSKTKEIVVSCSIVIEHSVFGCACLITLCCAKKFYHAHLFNKQRNSGKYITTTAMMMLLLWFLFIASLTDAYKKARAECVTFNWDVAVTRYSLFVCSCTNTPCYIALTVNRSTPWGWMEIVYICTIYT